MPTMNDVIEHCAPYKDSGGSIIVVDDFMLELNPFMAQLFTAYSHHYRISVILLTQNLFLNTPIYRNISRNTTYIAVFKNPRDVSQIMSLARQLSPKNTKYIIGAFQEATEKPFSYMLFDFHQTTPKEIVLRSCILRGEFPMSAWLPAENVT
jgi:hypothetical protein